MGVTCELFNFINGHSLGFVLEIAVGVNNLLQFFKLFPLFAGHDNGTDDDP